MLKFISKNKIISLSVAIAIIIFALSFTNFSKTEEENPAILNPTGKTSVIETKTPTQTQAKPVPKEDIEKITVIAGTEKINLSVAPNTIFYDALVQAKNAGKIEFFGKNYTGLGFFVTDIGTLHSGNGKDLLYYINGKEASVGVSSYTLKDGDVIEWKLE